MKYFVIFLVILGITVIMPQASGWCPEDTDWPDKPCYAPYQNWGLEKERDDWQPYYEFKGEQTMKSKLSQLHTAISNNMLQEWLDKSKENTNIHYYYFLNDEVPNHNGLHFEEALQLENINKAFDSKQEIVPQLLWNYNDIIVDGTIIEIDLAQTITGTDVPLYTIKVNKYLKGESSAAIVTGMDVYGLDFQLFEDGLFYLKKLDEYNRYGIGKESLKTFGNCDARDLIEISPVLPNEKPPRSMPAHPEDFTDPCVPYYYDTDPDERKFSYGPPLKQLQSGIPFDEIQCKQNLVLIQKYDGSPACVKPETIPRLMERDWIRDDAKQNVDEFDKTLDGHTSLNTSESDYIATCDPLIRKSTLPDIQIQNSTHSYDLQYCKWELHYPDLSLITNNYLMNDYPYCAELFDTLFDYYQSIRDDCGIQRYNEDGTPGAICTPAPAGAGIPRDINMIKSGCIDHYADWTYQTKHNDDVFYLFDRDEINDRIHGNLDEQIKIIDKLCADNDYLDVRPNIKFRNNTHWIDTDNCALNIKDSGVVIDRSGK